MRPHIFERDFNDAVAAISRDSNSNITPAPVTDILWHLWFHPGQAEGIAGVIVKFSAQVQSEYKHTIAQSLLESPAPLPELTGPPTSKSLDGRHSAPVHDTPDPISQGTLPPLTSLTNDIAASTSPEANNTRVGTIAASPTRSSASHRDNRFPDHVCCGDFYERCRRRYRYQKAWRKHFEKKHLNNLHMRGPLNDASDYLVCPHCPVKVHRSNKKNLMKHLWADHTRSN